MNKNEIPRPLIYICGHKLFFRQTSLHQNVKHLVRFSSFSPLKCMDIDRTNKVKLKHVKSPKIKIQTWIWENVRTKRKNCPTAYAWYSFTQWNIWTDKPFCNFGSSKYVPELHKIRRSPDLEVLKLLKGSSSNWVYVCTSGWHKSALTDFDQLRLDWKIVMGLGNMAWNIIARVWANARIKITVLFWKDPAFFGWNLPDRNFCNFWDVSDKYEAH